LNLFYRKEQVEKMSKKKSGLISVHGELWSRDSANFRAIEKKYGNPSGVYALYNGLTPVYFGHGRVSSRLRAHDRSGAKHRYWDHFSWYRVKNENLLKDLETLLLRMLPVYLHMLNRQRGAFDRSEKAVPGKKHHCELKRPKYGVGKRRGAKNKHR
jgi:hypothetical protein